MTKQAEAIRLTLRMLRPGFQEQLRAAMASVAPVRDPTMPRPVRRLHKANPASPAISNAVPVPKASPGEETEPVASAIDDETIAPARPSARSA